LGAEDESDSDLRARAKAVLRGSGKATLLAIDRAIREQRAKLAEVWDPNGPPAKRSNPGSVTLLIESEPDRFEGVNAAVHETRAAGVLATLVARYVFIRPRMKIAIRPNITAPGKLKLLAQVIAALQEYIDTLGAGDAVDCAKLIAAAKDVDDVVDVVLADIMAWQSDIGQPGAEALIDRLVDAIAAAAAGDLVALRATLADQLDAAALAAPTGTRTPNRDLIQGASGARATDGEIQLGTAQVVTLIDGEKWWAALDMAPTDIVLVEASNGAATGS
jgi:hypothetical protein